jgi:hypothetical protein
MSNKKSYQVFNVNWDTDGEDLALPTTFTVHVTDHEEDVVLDYEGGLDEYLSDWLSDTIGFCHFGFEYKETA